GKRRRTTSLTAAALAERAASPVTITPPEATLAESRFVAASQRSSCVSRARASRASPENGVNTASGRKTCRSSPNSLRPVTQFRSIRADATRKLVVVVPTSSPTSLTADAERCSAPFIRIFSEKLETQRSRVRRDSYSFLCTAISQNLFTAQRP